MNYIIYSLFPCVVKCMDACVLVFLVFNNFAFDQHVVIQNNVKLYKMEMFSSSYTPTMDWSNADLPNAWKSFRRHSEFVLGRPLKSKSEEHKCNYLMIWIGEKERDIFQTWNLTEDEEIELKSYYDRFEACVKPITNSFVSL